MALDLTRVVVVGTSCAGKTTFARALAQRLGARPFDLDHFFWDRDWKPKPTEQFRRLTADAAAGERWVAAGNYGDVRDILWPRATAVIWLNYSLPVVFWRALRRTVIRNLTREELWHGNRESFRRSFLSRQSILVWVLTTHHDRGRRLHALRSAAAFAHLSWIEFSRPRECELYLQSLQHGH